MKAVHQNGFTLLTVPEGSNDFSIIYEHNPYCVFLIINGRSSMPIGNLILPAKKVEVIGLGKDLTEEQWKGIVDWLKGNEKWSSYENGVPSFDTATESGHSLLKANNMNPNTTLILKKIL